MKTNKWEVFFGEEIENKAIYTDIGEDIKQRPKLFKFLKQVQKKGRSCHGPIPYSMLHNAFWSSLQDLSGRNHALIVDALVFNLSDREITKKNGIGRTRFYVLQNKAKENLKIHILERLKIERILLGFRD